MKRRPKSTSRIRLVALESKGVMSIHSRDAVFVLVRALCAKSQTSTFPSFNLKTGLVEETTAKFEREMILHAKDIETLQKVKAELEEVKASVRAAEEGAAAARSDLDLSKSSWEAQKRTLEQELTKLESRCVWGHEGTSKVRRIYLQPHMLVSSLTADPPLCLQIWRP